MRAVAKKVVQPRISVPTMAIKTVPGVRNSVLTSYWTLSKGYLSVWCALSTVPGYLVSVSSLSYLPLGCILGGSFLASAASQAMNQAREHVQDGQMARTKNRPIPTGKISVENANHFATFSALSGAGLLTFAASGSLAPAAVAAATIGLYVRVYTPMKQVSPYNTHVGAVAGSLPVLIGFAAAGGFPILLTPTPWVFFAIQTLWQFPHFYPLAWLYREDYLKGGYKMFPLDDSTGLETAKMCLPYMVALTLLPFASSAAGITSWMFPISASIANTIWGKNWYDFYTRPSKKAAKTYFLGSLWYLISIMGLFVLHTKEDREWVSKSKAKMKSICLHNGVKGDVSNCPI